MVGAGRRFWRLDRLADGEERLHRTWLRLEQPHPESVTLLESVWKIGKLGRDENRTVTLISKLLREYRVSLRGDLV